MSATNSAIGAPCTSNQTQMESHEDSVRIVLGGHKAKTVTDRHYTARNLPRFVPAIEALRFEAIGGLADIMPDEDARAA